MAANYYSQQQQPSGFALRRSPSAQPPVFSVPPSSYDPRVQQYSQQQYSQPQGYSAYYQQQRPAPPPQHPQRRPPVSLPQQTPPQQQYQQYQHHQLQQRSQQQPYSQQMQRVPSYQQLESQSTLQRSPSTYQPLIPSVQRSQSNFQYSLNNPPTKPAYRPAHSHSQSMPYVHAQTVTSRAISPTLSSGRPLPIPGRSDSLPLSGPSPSALAQLQRRNVFPTQPPPLTIDTQGNRSPESSPGSLSKRPLPLQPQSSPDKQSVDLTKTSPRPRARSTFVGSNPSSPTKAGKSSRTPSPTKAPASPTRRRTSPPRFNNGSRSPQRETPLNITTPPKITLPPSNPNKYTLPPLVTSDSSGQKFLPMWKKSLQSSSPSSAVPPSNGRPLPSAPASRFSARASSQSPTRSAYSSRTRSPAQSASSYNESEDDNGIDMDECCSVSSISRCSDRSGMSTTSSRSTASNQIPSSPQYGILDLPRRIETRPSTSSSHRHSQSLPQPPSMISQTRSLPPTLPSNSIGKPPDPPAMSRFIAASENTPVSATLRFAAMSLNNSGSGSDWPANLPRLPKTPSSPSSPVRGKQMINLDDSPPASVRHTPSPQPQQPISRRQSQRNGLQRQAMPKRDPLPQTPVQIQSVSVAPGVNIESPKPLGGRETRANIPQISFPGGQSLPKVTVYEVPGISVDSGPMISVSGPDDDSAPNVPFISVSGADEATPKKRKQVYRGGGLICGGCGGAIVGRIVAAMDVKWHPECFRCTVCDELLEHVSSYEHDGMPYCHLDYHENFAPKCYSCKTSIIEERFISLDDPNLGRRTYHEQHFFCSECGDPFMDPSKSSTRSGELAINGDGVFEDDDVGFVVYKGYPYCEACHVRLRLPKCKRCTRSIRDHMEAVEALGSKWHWECFTCARCDNPFEDPSFFERKGQPYCEGCFSIIIRNEV